MCVPIASAALARTDTAHVHGWCVYHVTRTGTVTYDSSIDHHPANCAPAVTAAAGSGATSAVTAPRRVARQRDSSGAPA